VRKAMTTIRTQARSNGLRLLRSINDAQAHGEEGARADPTRVAHEAVLEVGAERYQAAMAYLIGQAALLGDAHIASDDVGDQHPHGHASYFFTRLALTLLEGDDSLAGDVHPSSMEVVFCGLRLHGPRRFICGMPHSTGELGSSSRNSTPWCASATSPGSRVAPATREPGGGDSVVRRPKRSLRDERPVALTAGTVDFRHLDALLHREGR
jgi:hypothetical protein